MTRPIAATITRDRNGQALVVLDSEPFNGLEIRPVELRAMAQHLTALADMAHKLPMGGKGFKATKVQIGGNESSVDSEARNPSSAYSSLMNRFVSEANGGNHGI